jgi:hypothetical protein
VTAGAFFSEANMTSSPTFICEFSDGQTTVMTVFCRPEKLDLVRGIKLARHAYCSRTKREQPPQIEAARFESNGKILATYDAKQILEAVS